MKEQNEECCPEFDPAKWDKKTIVWDNKLFIKESLATFFHIPFPDPVHIDPGYGWGIEVNIAVFRFTYGKKARVRTVVIVQKYF